MKKIEIFDPTMCCSTGVCGPSVDKDLLRIAAVVEELKKQGIDIIRHNLRDEPQVYIDNEAVNQLLISRGIDVLPITLVEGEVVTSGVYPTNEQFEEWVGITLK